VTTKQAWVLRKQRYGTSGCRNPSKLTYWKDKEQSKEANIKRAISVNTWYSNPKNRSKFLKAHHKAHLGKPIPIEVREKISLTQKGYHNSPQNEFKKGHLNSESTRKKISESKKGKITWMKGKHHTSKSNEKNRLAHLGQKLTDETKERMSKSQKTRLRKNPDKVSFRIVARRHEEQGLIGYVSENQRKLFHFLKRYYSDAELEYPILTEESVRYADVGIPSKKLDCEYDSSLHKHFVSEEKEVKRDEELRRVGWNTIRIDDVMLQSLLKTITVA